MKPYLLMYAVLLMTLAIPVHAKDADLQELRAQCEEARQALLAPLREEETQKCIAEKQKSPEECERFYSDYGDGGRTAAGGHRERMFHDIPECQPLYEAEKERSTRN